MASDTDIANFALIRLGQKQIMSMDDNVEAARMLKAIYPMVRDAENGDHNWTFAAKRVMLAALNNVTPAWGYKYLYPVPDDLLCVVQVGENYPGVSLVDYRTSRQSDYRIEGRNIATNMTAPLPLLYNSQVTDPSVFDPLFCEALAYRLAMEVCEKLTQSNTKIQLLQAGYQAAISRAIRNDSIQSPPEVISDDSWVISRI